MIQTVYCVWYCPIFSHFSQLELTVWPLAALLMTIKSGTENRVWLNYIWMTMERGNSILQTEPSKNPCQNQYWSQVSHFDICWMEGNSENVQLNGNIVNGLIMFNIMDSIVYWSNKNLIGDWTHQICFISKLCTLETTDCAHL